MLENSNQEITMTNQETEPIFEQPKKSHKGKIIAIVSPILIIVLALSLLFIIYHRKVKHQIFKIENIEWYISREDLKEQCKAELLYESDSFIKYKYKNFENLIGDVEISYHFDDKINSLTSISLRIDEKDVKKLTKHFEMTELNSERYYAEYKDSHLTLSYSGSTLSGWQFNIDSSSLQTREIIDHKLTETKPVEIPQIEIPAIKPEYTPGTCNEEEYVSEFFGYKFKISGNWEMLGEDYLETVREEIRETFGKSMKDAFQKAAEETSDKEEKKMFYEFADNWLTYAYCDTEMAAKYTENGKVIGVIDVSAVEICPKEFEATLFGDSLSMNELEKMDELMSTNLLAGIEGETSGSDWIGWTTYDWEMISGDSGGATMKVYMLVTTEHGVLSMIRITALDGYEQEVFDSFLANTEKTAYIPILGGSSIGENFNSEVGKEER